MSILLALLLAGCAILFLWAWRAQARANELSRRFKGIGDAEAVANKIRELGKRQADALIDKATSEANDRSLEIIADAKKQRELLEAEVASLRSQLAKQKERIGAQKDLYSSQQAELERLRKEVAQASELANLIDVGYYEPVYGFDGLDGYQRELDRIHDSIKNSLKIDGSDGDSRAAAFCASQITYNNSRAQGQAMIKKVLKLMLRAFNGESDSFIARVTYKNVQAMNKRIQGSFDQINRIGSSWSCQISDQYLRLRLDELHLVYEYEEAKQREKEEQARIREQMREEERELRALEKARDEAEREEQKYEEMLRKAQKEAEQASEQDRAKMAEKIARLEALLAEAEANRQRAISQAQLTRSGHVYIISNVGSFGENVYKIGMTRRLEPLDRVRELGDASVPFPFDVHALIFSEDAPAMENALHKRFDSKRVNLENTKKEFFRVSIQEICDELERLKREEGLRSELHITLLAEAKQFRMSEAKRKHLEASYAKS